MNKVSRSTMHQMRPGLIAVVLDQLGDPRQPNRGNEEKRKPEIPQPEEEELPGTDFPDPSHRDRKRPNIGSDGEDIDMDEEAQEEPYRNEDTGPLPVTEDPEQAKDEV